MKKRPLQLALASVAMFGLVAAFASTAQAFPTQSSRCSGCHSLDSGVVVTAVQTANDGTNATYNVTVSNPYGMNGWGVFSGSTKLSGGAASSGTFLVADGSTYTIFGVSGDGNGTQGYGTISISPVKPAPVPTPVPTPTPDPTPVPTITPDPTPVPTITPDPTPVPTPVPTITPDPTPVPTPVPTITPDPTPVPTPVPTITPDPTPTPNPNPGNGEHSRHEFERHLHDFLGWWNRATHESGGQSASSRSDD